MKVFSVVLLIDNYDSFVFNLARYLRELGVDVRVVRNDAVTVADIERAAPRAIVISPGPCTPREAGISIEVVRTLGATVPILGVCLGHQAVGAAFGTDIVRASEPVHGRASPIHHDGTGLFAGLPSPLSVGRYHSLVIDEASLGEDLQVTARLAGGEIMAVSHRTWPVYGVQFHPESVLTPDGHLLLFNFLRLAGIPAVFPAAANLSSSKSANDTRIAPGKISQTTAFW